MRTVRRDERPTVLAFLTHLSSNPACIARSTVPWVGMCRCGPGKGGAAAFPGCRGAPLPHRGCVAGFGRASAVRGVRAAGQVAYIASGLRSFRHLSGHPSGWGRCGGLRSRRCGGSRAVRCKRSASSCAFTGATQHSSPLLADEPLCAGTTTMLRQSIV